MRRFKSVWLYFMVAVVYVSIPAGQASALELHAFMDVAYIDSGKEVSVAGTDVRESEGHFGLGQLDFYASEQLGDHMAAFVEYVFENNGEEWVSDLERIWVQYRFADALSVRAGRFHTSLGYWNRSFHHGAMLHTSVIRPLFLDFEDGDFGILPTHTIGLMALGKLTSGTINTRYEIQVGNGSNFNGSEIDPGSISDNNAEKGLGLRLTFSAPAIDGLGVGFSGNWNEFETATDDAAYPSGFRPLAEVTIYAVDVVYDNGSLEFLAEYYQINSKDKMTGSGETFSTAAYYIQGGYLIADAFTPYIRFEKLDVDTKGGVMDIYISTLGKDSYDQTLAGLKWDVADMSSIKVEVGSIEEEGLDSYSVFRAQWSFGF